MYYAVYVLNIKITTKINLLLMKEYLLKLTYYLNLVLIFLVCKKYSLILCDGYKTIDLKNYYNLFPFLN